MRDSTAIPTKLGKYEVRTLLGKGSMGMVFLGHDPILERDVAIKIMAGASVFDQKMQERFEREAKAVGQLHHPNIVTVHDLGYARADLPYIAMELLEGADLDTLIDSNQLSLTRKFEILIQVCRGLTHAHENRVVHRDIKPANIFVTTDGTAKIMDFGVSRWTQSSQTQSGLVVGTAGYMAPEQICGQRIDGRSDVFSVGVVLYEVLTTQQLFSGDSLEAIFFATLSKKPPILSLPDGTEIPALQKILQKTLARHPEERYASAEELGDALTAVMHQHLSALPPNTTFTAAEAAIRMPGSSHRPTVHNVQAHAPTRVPDLKATIVPRSNPRRAQPTRRVVTPPRASRLPVVAFVLVVVISAGVYAVLLRPSQAPLSYASAPARVETPRDASPEPVAEPVPEPIPEAPPPSELSATLLADAALAVSQSRLDSARSLIAQGESIAPDDARWAALREELSAKEADAAWRSRATNYVRQGRDLFDERRYAESIDAYQQAMQHDPGNSEARAGFDAAIDAQRRVDTTPRPERRFTESRTEYVAGPSGSEAMLGFESQDDLEIKETADPFFPATVIIELEPVDARAGEPYVLRVKIFNEGYRLVELQSLQLVSRFGDQTTGAGQSIVVRTPTIAPQATAVLHEISGVWKESQNRAEIEATVTLADGGKLIKTLSW